MSDAKETNESVDAICVDVVNDVIVDIEDNKAKAIPEKIDALRARSDIAGKLAPLSGLESIKRTLSENAPLTQTRRPLSRRHAVRRSTIKGSSFRRSTLRGSTRSSTRNAESFMNTPGNGWNGTTHPAVEVYRTFMQSREQNYIYENDEEATDILPFIEEFLDATGSVEGEMRKGFNDLGLFPAMELKFKDLSFKVTARDADGNRFDKTILHSLSGTFASGSLVAIMGPSGCGKSTLLDILSQKKKASYTGEVTVNGHAPDKFFTRTTSYVPQDEFGSGLETVRESAMFASDMKAVYSDDGANASLRQQHLDFLLNILGLAHIADSFVGDGQTRGISGGQRKRLTLLKGLITGPGIAFLDEPTSGLSSTDSEMCVRALKNLAKLTGTTFVVVIHQPKTCIFDMFDHLVLLSEGRQCITVHVPRPKTILPRWDIQCRTARHLPITFWT